MKKPYAPKMLNAHRVYSRQTNRQTALAKLKKKSARLREQLCRLREEENFKGIQEVSADLNKVEREIILINAKISRATEEFSRFETPLF